MTPALRTPRELRDQVERLIRGDLLGPAGGEHEEVAEARVSERYLVGMLAARRAHDPVSDEHGEDVVVAGAADGQEGTPEPSPPVVGAGQLMPSALGMTFTVAPGVDELLVRSGWGQYLRAPSETLKHLDGRPRLVWKRTPRGAEQRLGLADGRIEPVLADPEVADVHISGRVRTVGGARIVTLFLVNDQPEPEQRADEAWLFQAALAVRAPHGAATFEAPPLTPSPDLSAVDRRELEELALQHRDDVELAVGHGTAVHVTKDPADPRLASEVRTVAIPAHELTLVEAPDAKDEPRLAGAVLDMKALAEMDGDRLADALAPLASAYGAWIDDEQARLDAGADRLAGHEEAGRRVIAACRQARERLRAGIAALANPEVRESFQVANRAMWQQRVTTIAAAEARRHGGSYRDRLDAADVERNRSWRPFQLAFVVTNLPGVARLDGGDRSADAGLVDLLWFPTGGGKTEAYLGLTAFTLVLRRLQSTVAGRDGGDGVGVLMRYTLRLLTLQQFQRATALLCALEIIRREAQARGDTRLGDTRFRIGLWVGGTSTPNTFEQSKAKVQDIHDGKRPGGATPLQLARCPWCGLPLDPGRDLVADATLRRTLTYCSDKVGRCPFGRAHAPGEGLPVVVVDEEVYRLLPGLIIATVDKFAQMPRNGAVQNFFGRVGRRCERHGFRFPDDERFESDSHPAKGQHPRARTVPATRLRPPDLVIQDELHLIAGPLGSLVGLYETAVDRLSSWEVDGATVRPKVIASTATIRRAPQQVRALFDRDVVVFPPPGLDARDSFFARRRDAPDEREAKPGRRYLGVCAPGRRLKAALIRTYVTELAAAQAVFDIDERADPWMTLVGYFNSLRELGGMRRLVEDDVATRLRRTDERGLAKRRAPVIDELTSRKTAEQIPQALDQLALPFRHGDPPKGAARPRDVVLATNMISVGVDVQRLGAMIVAGQPKGTSEYIQATSRVGRDAKGPGLVLCVYNWARPRDLSHYERFEHYHATLYRQVEALSVTPFAARARDRGLTGVLAALLRLPDGDWSANLGAEAVQRTSPRTAAAIEALAARAGAVTHEQAVADAVTEALTARMDLWEKEQQVPSRRLGYRPGGEVAGLLADPGPAPWTGWTVPNSLREVEAPARLLLREDATRDVGEDEA